MIVYLARDITAFLMYCVNGESGSSILIESTDSMIISKLIPITVLIEASVNFLLILFLVFSFLLISFYYYYIVVYLFKISYIIIIVVLSFLMRPSDTEGTIDNCKIHK